MSKRNQLVTVVALIPVALVLTGCSGPRVGIVHDRDFTPAHTVLINQCNVIGKSTVCHLVPIYEGDSWSLDVYASKDDHGWVEVDETAYNKCAVGSTFNHGSCK